MTDPGRETVLGRLTILSGVLTLGVAGLGIRLLQVQVFQSEYYTKAAERNRSQLIRQTAPRGRIYDRSGEVVAENQAVFSLIYLPGKDRNPHVQEGLARDLAPLLRQDPEGLLKNLRKAVKEESAIRLAEKLSPKAMFKLSELRTIYPGVILIVEARRFYPQRAFAAHLLGHMGKMDEAGWARLKSQGYRVDSWIGRAGIEKLFERDLRGKDGGMRMEVDARGRLKRILENLPWKPGSNITLTLDAKLQRIAEEALRKSPSERGAVVALDPRNGDILVLASIPDFDPNWFLIPETEQAPVRLKDLPTFNLAVQGSYPPGSTFKTVTSAAMLDTGKVRPQDRVFCPGHFELGSRVFLCWEPKGHKFKDFIGGITHSCDVYFYRMGLRAGGDVIERYERMFRIGQKTEIGLDESPGHAFGPLGRRAAGRSWYDGDTVNLSIGQGEILVTPMQMAVLTAAVANSGILWRPHFIQRIEYADGRPEYRRRPEELGRATLKPETWSLLHAGLENVVKEGTGARVAVPGLVIGGKTGTAQNPHGKDHAWFTAYAGRPGEEPSLALAVLGQYGGHGSEAAVPVAKAILQAAFEMAP